MPKRLISGETEADLEILILLLPEPFFLPSKPGPLIELSGISSRSFIFTCERRIPIWTNKLPFVSGKVLMTPFRFMDRTLTLSPIRKVLGLIALWGQLSFFRERLLSTFFRLSLNLARSVSRARVSIPEEEAILLIFLIVRSAVSLASRRIFWASSLAERINFSFRSSKRSSFCSSRAFKRPTSFL